jgi:hypothetical protein
MESNLLYDRIYNDNLYSESFILEENIEDLLLDLNILYDAYKTDLLSIEKKIENLKLELFKFFFDRSKRNRYKNELVPFEERTYDSDGWITNEDWLEYYEYNKRI